MHFFCKKKEMKSEIKVSVFVKLMCTFHCGLLEAHVFICIYIKDRFGFNTRFL